MSATDAADRRIGPYRLVKTLGEGGMGVVHQAVDDAGRDVALKLLKAEFAGDMTFRRRLAREVDTMRRVRSPHVAEVLDADVAAERPYVVTRFIDGQPLDSVVRATGPLAGGPLARMAAGLADAVTAIHDAGVVHRDLKPNNVMLVDGAPVVIDFGIAHAADASRLTRTGMIVGTPGYLGPEVIDGRPPGPAVDVYGWAATVAFAATGRAPFGGGSLEAVLARIITGRPDLDGAPPRLVPLLRAGLARDPDERPPAASLAAAVRRADLAAPAPPTRAVPAADAADAADALAEPPGLPGTPGRPGTGPAGAPGTRVPLGWYRLFAYLAIVVLVAATGLAPVLGTALVVAAVWYLRAGDSAVRSRRVRIHGAHDLVLAPVRVPGSFGRSTAMLVPALAYAGLAALLAGLGLLAWSVTGHHGWRGGSSRWIAVAFAWAVLAAPGVMAPRRQVVRLLSLAQNRAAAARTGLATGVLAALAAGAVWTSGPHWWPAADPHPLLSATTHRITSLLRHR